MRLMQKDYSNLSIAELVKTLKQVEEKYLWKVKNKCNDGPKLNSLRHRLRPSVTVNKKDGDTVVSFYLVSDEYVYYKPYYLRIKEGKYVRFFEESYSENNRRYNEMHPDNYAEELAIVKNSIIQEIQVYE